MPFFKPTVACCTLDGRENVICCSSCSACGNHAHGTCGPSSGARNAVVATCPVCNKGGVLCCTTCGSCGNHAHSHS